MGLLIALDMPAEETEAASTVIPRSMLASVALNGKLGFAMVIATLFSLTDVDAALHSLTGVPPIHGSVSACHRVQLWSNRHGEQFPTLRSLSPSSLYLHKRIALRY